MPNFGNFFAAIENIEGQDEQVYSSDSHSFPVQEVTDLSSIWQGGFQGGIMSDQSPKLQEEKDDDDGECKPGDNSERCKVVTVTDYGDSGFKSSTTSSYSTSNLSDFDKDDIEKKRDVGNDLMGNNIMSSILSSFGGLNQTFDEP